MSTGGSPQPADDRPVLRIVRGDPTAEELAALVAVLGASGGRQDDAAPAPAVSQWAPPARLLRRAVVPTGWWESSLPR